MLEAQSAQHKRTISHESSSSAGSAHRLILEHIFQYPGTYELPLRTMYALNSVPHTTALPKLPNGQVSPKRVSMLRPEHAAQRLECSLMAEMSQLPNQPNSLPPAFITSFVRKCFASELRLVDFSQALTGLDYLKDLETRRTRELKAALDRLEINLENCDVAEDILQQRYPAAHEWYSELTQKVHKVEALYTQLYVALRRWRAQILINELSLVPYSKHNCVAMLNTVYPPVMSGRPTTLLTASVLKSQRDGFFKYIQAVEKNGPALLSNLISQGKRVDEETGWPAAREVLDKYLQAANSMLDECQEIVSIHDTAKIMSAQDARRKADSGIDFVESRKSSTSSEKSALTERPVSRSFKSSTALEKIAREFRHMRRTKTDVSEMITTSAASDGTATPPTESRSLRKMKSLGSLGLRRQASRTGSVASQKMPEYDLAKLNQQRKAHEATLMVAAI
ncbi:hypothetical protein ANO11243_035460 [Dothideomycetidae sp. 11243]|nr:hypothetical protein ANO11243_035460 [fungal sp. No.11243]